MNASPEPLLEFAGAGIAEETGAHLGLDAFDARLFPGELHLFEVSSGRDRLPLADLALGIEPPSEGRVLFDGIDWSERRGRALRDARFAIGRVFEGAEWVSNLNVDENVLLASCHHTRRPEAEILADAIELARRFGLDDLTSRRPNLVEERELRAYALVRAFLPRPRLLVLEHPLRGVRRRHGDALFELVAERREQGACVVWIEAAGDERAAEALRPSNRWVIEPPSVRPLQETSA